MLPPSTLRNDTGTLDRIAERAAELSGGSTPVHDDFSCGCQCSSSCGSAPVSSGLVVGVVALLLHCQLSLCGIRVEGGRADYIYIYMVL